MNERTGGEAADDEFEFADELRGQKAKVDDPISMSDGLPDASVPTNPPRLGSFRPSEPNE